MREPDPEPRNEATRKDSVVVSAKPTASSTRSESVEVNP
jgi:hypothetical protein